MAKVSKKKLDKYLKGGVLDEDIFMKVLASSSNSIDVPQHRLDDMDRRMKENSKFEKALYSTADLNNDGIKLEREGRIGEAKRAYEKSIGSGYPASHAFRRLMVLYRKDKDFVNEIRVIRKAMAVFPRDPEYKNRLLKAEELQKKSK